jgi:hypothetical protein
MNFQQATDRLFSCLTAADLADALQVSVQGVKQARAAPETTAHRPAPDGWQMAVKRLAKRQAAHFERLATQLDTKK